MEFSRLDLEELKEFWRDSAREANRQREAALQEVGQLKERLRYAVEICGAALNNNPVQGGLQRIVEMNKDLT